MIGSLRHRATRPECCKSTGTAMCARQMRSHSPREIRANLGERGLYRRSRNQQTHGRRDCLPPSGGGQVLDGSHCGDLDRSIGVPEELQKDPGVHFAQRFAGVPSHLPPNLDLDDAGVVEGDGAPFSDAVAAAMALSNESPLMHSLPRASERSSFTPAHRLSLAVTRGPHPLPRRTSRTVAGRSARLRDIDTSCGYVDVSRALATNP